MSIIKRENTMTRLLIRDLAAKRDLNITTLARKAELAYTTVHALWHDSAKVWNRHSLDRIALALGVRVADLFDGEPERD
jgi:DNA-binding Xre family transcriptional regulator